MKALSKSLQVGDTMIEISIAPAQVTQAKEEIKSFDAQKTHNKGNWSGNWKGPLGETLMEDWLQSFDDLSFDAMTFVKRGWTEPDFRLHTNTTTPTSVDIKTTTHYANWSQNPPKHDIYVWSELKGSPNNPHTLIIKGWLSKQQMTELMAESSQNDWDEKNTQNGCYKVEREAWGKMRTDWCFTDNALESMDDFVTQIIER